MLAIIPGRADDGAFVQVITNNRSYNIPYPLSVFRKGRDSLTCRDSLRVGNNTFSPSGLALDISHPELTLSGEIRYTDLTPVRGDIMGPFRFFPMECRHGVGSMNHSLCGAVTLNGEVLDFTGGSGYMESDSGRSFPGQYIWVQCNDFEQNVSIVASVAWIPFYGLSFWGCICVVWINGREYRLATYNGVKILRCEPGFLDIRRGKYRLTITIGTDKGQSLAAPRSGAMKRVIRESLSCPAQFRFTEGDSVLLDSRSNHTSYECTMETRP